MAPIARNPNGPDTVVLIHGLWMTALSWEHWIERYEKAGYKVIAKSWPGMDIDIGELRSKPELVAGLTVDAIVDQYEDIIRTLDTPPIIMGHSFGGLFTQILIDRNLGAAGVAIATAPVKGVLVLPFSTIKASAPALLNPFNYNRAAPLTPEQFHYAFGNNLSEAESRKAYDRYAVPGPDHVLFQAALANFNPLAPTAVDFKNDERAPLLLISGGKDHVSPTALNRMNFNLYKESPAVVEMKDYPNRSHFTLAEPGWEEVADDALNWAVSHARMPLAPSR
jgi:pimeloyl-ACP methyl ester carboxylesterase